MDDRSLHGAFVELHAERLHGFALLVTLGDRERAARLTESALARAARQMAHLRHPERAAAWLRGTVTASARDADWGYRRPPAAERRTVLASLGVDDPAFDALAALDSRARAAIVAGEMERLAPADVSEIVGGNDRVRRARRSYLTAYLAAARTRGTVPRAGDLAERVRLAAGPLLSPTRR